MDPNTMDLRNIDTPCLLIDKDKITYNIEQAIVYAGGLDRLRPHVKTHKMLEVAQMQLKAGINKFKCSTIPEAEMLGMAGAKDVLLAYQPQGPKIKRLHSLILKYPNTRYRALLDNNNTAKQMHEIFQFTELPLEVFIDVNDGHNRTGIKPQDVDSLLVDCKKLTGISIVGLHCYDGHIRMSSLEERTKECRTAFVDVVALKNKIEKQLGKQLNMVAGGCPSFSVHSKYHDVECSPGTWIFWDERYEQEYEELPFVKAAVLATRVISKIDSYTYCLDLGHKSVASEMPLPRVTFVGEETLTQIGHSEEHLTVKSDIADSLEVGDILMAYPYHICPTVALYDHVKVVEDGEIVDEWKVIARDRKITI